MRVRSEAEIVRILRRVGFARVTVNVEPTLLGPWALEFSIRRAGWQVRQQSGMFGELRAACEQVSRILNENRKLIHRFALVLDEGVLIDVVLPESGMPFIESLQDCLRECFEKRGLRLDISVLPHRCSIEARLERASPDELPDLPSASGADQTNVVVFPPRSAPKHEPNAALGAAFYDEPALVSLAMRLYPLGIRRLSDLSQSFIARLYRSETGGARYRVLILLEGWMVENQIEFA